MAMTDIEKSYLRIAIPSKAVVEGIIVIIDSGSSGALPSGSLEALRNALASASSASSVNLALTTGTALSDLAIADLKRICAGRSDVGGTIATQINALT